MMCTEAVGVGAYGGTQSCSCCRQRPASWYAAISSAAAGQAAADLPLSHIADIPLPGRAARLDYMSYDADRHLLFIAHLDDSEVIVFDTLNSRVVSRIGQSRFRTWRAGRARTGARLCVCHGYQ
ncbi:hypothetical protein LMG27174_06813 [Paraburkholderia rhynchosiae]|uniref:Uncharacterized protein n=1 Tax=Paraburkholderia rhynchosiae TaxID=487049 RepID=A0A6J5CRG9_9BURK|nr:hypothetical protein LMG27174_06813 [Paraburkholderia rhynchosiae]